MTEPTDPTPPPEEGSGKAADKFDRLADDAVAAGQRLTDSAAGRKAVEIADTVFDKAEELGRKALESETGRKVADKAHDLHHKALDTDIGRKVADRFADKAHDLGDSEAGQTAQKIWKTPLGRNVGTGAAAGAAAGLIVPFFGPLFGAVIGGGLGYLRTLAKKSDGPDKG